MKCWHIVYKRSEFGQSLGWECTGTGDSDVYVGVGSGGAFWPGPKPDDLDVGA